jgi:hypothetical protein
MPPPYGQFESAWNRRRLQILGQGDVGLEAPQLRSEAASLIETPMQLADLLKASVKRQMDYL